MKTKNKMPKIINLGYQYDNYWRFRIEGFPDDYWEAHCQTGRFNRQACIDELRMHKTDGTLFYEGISAPLKKALELLIT